MHPQSKDETQNKDQAHAGVGETSSLPPPWVRSNQYPRKPALYPRKILTRVPA